MFPRNTQLRIGFGLFLCEKLEMLEVALRQFSRAESLKPPLDEQFIIYRYTKIIQDEIDSSLTNKKGYENTLDFVKKAQFNKKLKQLKRLQEKSTQIHLEFWSQL